MCAICDVNEYRKCVRVLNTPLVIQLFDILHALCNLLLVKHENLPEVCGGETLVCLDHRVLLESVGIVALMVKVNDNAPPCHLSKSASAQKKKSKTFLHLNFRTISISPSY